MDLKSNYTNLWWIRELQTTPRAATEHNPNLLSNTKISCAADRKRYREIFSAKNHFTFYLP